MTNKETVKAFYDDINRGDYSAYDRYCHEDFEDLASHGIAKGRETAKQATLAMHGSFTGIRMTLDELVQEGDSVAVRGRISGRQIAPFFGLPNHGRDFEITYCGIYHLKDGRIVRRYVNGDDQGFARQLGWAPA